MNETHSLRSYPKADSPTCRGSLTVTVWLAEGEGGGRGGTSPSGLPRGREDRGAPPQLEVSELSLSLSPAVSEDSNMSWDSQAPLLSSLFSGGSEFIFVLLLGGLDIPARGVTLGTHLKIS